jgi:hypothetical protein
MVAKWITSVINQYDSIALSMVSRVKLDPVIICSLTSRLAKTIPFALIQSFYHEMTNYMEATQQASLITFVDIDNNALAKIMTIQVLMDGRPMLQGRYITECLLSLDEMREPLMCSVDTEDMRADAWSLFILFARHLVK